MTEEEATYKLISLTREYMKHTPEERKILYPEYQANRNKIKEDLINTISIRKQSELENEKII